jgi:hypothetical protein
MLGARFANSGGEPAEQDVRQPAGEMVENRPKQRVDAIEHAAVARKQ